ncbi:MAG TPA: hypothetical protein VEJ47_15120 [Candidatus Eremiobacteraceae bacterium]|nr:hypothetical protein [Candidatus Eremiobacteraceae bacterium]
MSMKLNGLRIVAACAAIMTIAALARPVKAGGVSADTLALFPKDTGEIGYVDLKKARGEKWFPALREQILPDRFRQFEKFLASAGVDPNSQVDELVWGLVPESTTKNDKGVSTDIPSSEMTVGIAMGNYNPETTEAYFKQQNLSMTQLGNYTLFAFGSGSGATDLFFFFLDSSKAVFGHKPLLEKLLDIHMGKQDGLLRNDQMYNRINEVNGSSVVWAVLDAGYTRLAMQQLAPEVQQFPEAAALVQRMQAMIITANASSGVDSKFQAVCASTGDANTLSQLMSAGLLLKKYQASKDNPDLAQLLDQANISPSGDRVVVALSVSDDQMTSLIQRNTFSLKM